MRILIDTNIFSYRENDHVLTDELQHLLKILTISQGIEILIHPETVEEIKRDQNEDRKSIALSKLNTYPSLESPPDQSNDDTFLSIVETPSRINDGIDNALLYAVYKDAVDFLITEDKGIHKKAIRSDIEDRVLCVEEGVGVFEEYIFREGVRPPALKEDVIYNLDIIDPIFRSLKEEYEEFDSWFKKISREGRKCWVYRRKDGAIGAILIYKIENEPIDSIPPLPAKKRLKITTLIVTHVEYKIGELFTKLAVGYSIKSNLTEIYLTHFTKPNDYLVDLITEYGFYKAAVNNRGEDVFVKELSADKEKAKLLAPPETSKRYYPSFYGEVNTKKFLVPIRPEYHQRLFTYCKDRQTTLSEHAGEFIVEGNTIKKAHLSHSKTKNISPCDILLFYRTVDTHEINSLGVVGKAFSGLQDRNEIFRYVRNRTVYYMDEIEDRAKKANAGHSIYVALPFTKSIKAGRFEDDGDFCSAVHRPDFRWKISPDKNQRWDI